MKKRIILWILGIILMNFGLAAFVRANISLLPSSGVIYMLRSTLPDGAPFAMGMVLWETVYLVLLLVLRIKYKEITLSMIFRGYATIYLMSAVMMPMEYVLDLIDFNDLGLYVLFISGFIFMGFGSYVFSVQKVATVPFIQFVMAIKDIAGISYALARNITDVALFIICLFGVYVLNMDTPINYITAIMAVTFGMPYKLYAKIDFIHTVDI